MFSQCAIGKYGCHFRSVITSDDRDSIVANHHDLICQLTSAIYSITTRTSVIFQHLFWLYFQGIICFIDHACLIQNTTSLADGYSIGLWMTFYFKYANCHTFMPSITPESRMTRGSVTRFGRSGNPNLNGSKPGQVKPKTSKLILVSS